MRLAPAPGRRSAHLDGGRVKGDRGLSRLSGTRYAGWVDLRPIYTRCRAEAMVNRTDERGRARKTVDLQTRSALRLLWSTDLDQG
jgi:hypothetical protein